MAVCIISQCTLRLPLPTASMFWDSMREGVFRPFFQVTREPYFEKVTMEAGLPSCVFKPETNLDWLILHSAWISPMHFCAALWLKEQNFWVPDPIIVSYLHY